MEGNRSAPQPAGAGDTVPAARVPAGGLRNASELAATATKHFDEVTRANQISDDHLPLPVLAATVLFFFGVRMQLERLELRMILVGLALVVFLVSTGVLLGVPLALWHPAGG